MKILRPTRQYEKDYKLAIKRGKDMRKLQLILDLLMDEKNLPTRCKLHKLSGDYGGYWECHIEPDWLLIYDIQGEALVPVRTGTHSDLF